MTHRRPPKPSPARDFRALAESRPQRALPLPIRTSADTMSDAVLEALPDDVELHLRTDAAGARVTLVASVVYRRSDELRRLAARMLEAAAALERTTAEDCSR